MNESQIEISRIEETGLIEDWQDYWLKFWEPIKKTPEKLQIHDLQLEFINDLN